MNSGGNDSLILKGKQRQHPAPEGEPSLKEGRSWGGREPSGFQKRWHPGELEESGQRLQLPLPS